ncbi:MAG: hypothetical protein JSR66_27810 [Proteobacteria bacterium]|nr:hypothetical protein [Pseudomonadota bacterium]
MVSIVSLLALVNSRNVHLSDKARACVEEFLYKKEGQNVSGIEAHRNRLVEQADTFYRRYQRMGYAFALLAITLTLMAARLFTPGHLAKLWLFGLAAAGYAVALILCIAEVLYEGFRTLKSHLQVLPRPSQGPSGTQSAPSPSQLDTPSPLPTAIVPHD